MFGLIAETIGWEYVFHATSLIGIIWFILWQYLVYDTPYEHPRISESEKRYIKSSLGKSTGGQKVGYEHTVNIIILTKIC